MKAKLKIVKRQPINVQVDGNQKVKDSSMMSKGKAKVGTGSRNKVPGDSPGGKRRSSGGDDRFEVAAWCTHLLLHLMQGRATERQGKSVLDKRQV